MDLCEEYVRRCAKEEDGEVDTLSQWKKSLTDVLKARSQRLQHSVKKNLRFSLLFIAAIFFPVGLPTSEI